MAEVVEVKNLYSLLLGAKFIGAGTCATCFLMRDGRVLKLYRNSENKRKFFDRREVLNHLKRLSTIASPFLISPDCILIKKGKVIGYIMRYINAPTIDKINPTLPLIQIRESFKIVEEVVKKVSEEEHFRFIDLKNHNLLFHAYFYFIDLDYGIIEGGVSYELAEQNLRAIARVILNGLFKVDQLDKDLYFHNYEIDNLYQTMYSRDALLFHELLDAIEEEIAIVKPTVGNLLEHRKKLIYTEKHIDYYQRDSF